MNFIANNSSDIDEVLIVVENANFKKANGTTVYDETFTVVKTKSGVVKVVVGEVAQNVFISNQNLLQVNWTNNVTGYLSSTNAQTFWNKTNKPFQHFVDGNYYIKYDPDSGELLFGDIQNHKIFGFYEGLMNLNIVNNVGGIDKIFPYLKDVHGVSGSRNVITLSVNGISLHRSSSKTTIALGSYMEGTKEMLEDQLRFLKGSDFGGGQGRIQLLNIDDNVVNVNGGWDNFRTTYNFPYLEVGIANPNNFEFAFITQPTIENVFKLNNIGSELLTGYGEEIKYLLEHGVNFVKFNGQTISIKSIIENTSNLKDKLLGIGVYQGQTVYLNIAW